MLVYDCGGRIVGQDYLKEKMLPMLMYTRAHTCTHTHLCTHTDLQSSEDVGKAQHYET